MVPCTYDCLLPNAQEVLASPEEMGNATCYTYDGSHAEDIPCGFPSVNQCCGSGWDCLSNGLCQLHGTTSFSQGSCTNANYYSCLSFCNRGMPITVPFVRIHNIHAPKRLSIYQTELVVLKPSTSRTPKSAAAASIAGVALGQMESVAALTAATRIAPLLFSHFRIRPLQLVRLADLDRKLQDNYHHFVFVDNNY